MRIFFWNDTFPPTNRGGVDMFGHQLIRSLRQQGLDAEVEVICDYGPEPLPPVTQYDGITVRRFPFAAALAGKDVSRIKSLVEELRGTVRSFRPDLIHMNTLQMAAFFYLKVPERRNCKMVLTLHGPPADPLCRGVFQRQVAAEADATVAVSEATQRDYFQYFPERRGAQYVILNGLEFPQGDPVSLLEGTLRLFSAGRLAREKGFDVMLEALALAKNGSIHWTLAGEGNEAEPLKRLCESLGLQERVTFLGHVSWQEVYAQIDRSHAMVVPSRWQEPFGLVALQAAQRGRVVLASRVGGLPEVVENGETGILFEPENPAALAQLLDGVAMDIPLLAAMGTKSARRAGRLFSPDVMARKYWDVFNQTLAA